MAGFLCKANCANGFRRFFVPTATTAEGGLKPTNIGLQFPQGGMPDNNQKRQQMGGPVTCCGICGDALATCFCAPCGGAMCNECDSDLHSRGILMQHKVAKLEPHKLQSTHLDSQPLLVDAEHLDTKKEPEEKNGHGDEHGDGHGDGGHGDHDEHAPVERLYLTEMDKKYAGAVCGISFFVVIVMCIWSAFGLMAEHEMVHVIGTNTRPGHMHGTMYSTPANIILHGTQDKFFEVRIIMMSAKNHFAHHRRLDSNFSSLRLLSDAHDTHSSHDDHSSDTHSSHDDHHEDTHSSHDDHHEDTHSSHDDDHHEDTHSSHDDHSAGGHMSHDDHSTGHDDHADTHSSHDDHSAGGHMSHDDHDDHSTDSHDDADHDDHSKGHEDPHDESHKGNDTMHSEHEHGHEDHGHDAHGDVHGDAHGEGHGDGHGAHHGDAEGSFTYWLQADGQEFFRKTVKFREPDVEYEEFMGINVMDAGAEGAETYSLHVTCNRTDHQECGFAAQVVQMPQSGAFREIIGIVIFVVCFVGIISEKIHRVYSAMLGSAAAVCAVTAIQETLHLHSVTGMIDYGTLMLLFSMMILMKMLQETGFFNWFAIKVVKASKGNPRTLFFALTNICGILSMFLDNVTTVMLFGPLTYSLCKQMNLNPRYIYLPMAICATIGGTGTLIGDPPNIVIGSKLQIGFATFLKYNFPVIVFVSLPAASSFLYWKLKDRILAGEVPKLDFETLEAQNRITDMPKFAKLCGILMAVLAALLTAPLHHIEPAWFTVMAMFAGAILFQPHSIHHYLMAVEWDTLFFFACLFVLVESLSELGVIKMIGNAIKDLIMAFPEDQRTLLAIIMLLWICAFGSAFLESLPFTTTVVYILLDMKQQDTGTFDPGIMAWPLSVGACVGGIGSIMGSSANLVSMAVSNRQAKTEGEKIQGSDFLKHGLPTMMVVIFLCMIWQILLFAIIGAPAE